MPEFCNTLAGTRQVHGGGHVAEADTVGRGTSDADKFRGVQRVSSHEIGANARCPRLPDDQGEIVMIAANIDHVRLALLDGGNQIAEIFGLLLVVAREDW